MVRVLLIEVIFIMQLILILVVIESASERDLNFNSGVNVLTDKLQLLIFRELRRLRSILQIRYVFLETIREEVLKSKFESIFEPFVSLLP